MSESMHVFVDNSNVWIEGKKLSLIHISEPTRPY